MTHCQLKYGFLLFNNFSMFSYASAIEPLRMVNRLKQNIICSWDTCSIDDSPVAASCGLNVNPDTSIDSISAKPEDYDALFVCSGTHVEQSYSKTACQLLHRVADHQVPLGAISTGTYLLARAGLLDGYHCTVDGNIISLMRKEFPRLMLTEDIIQIDRDRYTCSGGLATADFMLHLIGSICGREKITGVSDMFMLRRTGGVSDYQAIPMQHRAGTSRTKLTEIVMLMEANIEEPLKLSEITRYVRITRRQIERLFHEQLACSPMQYYTRLRLKYARRLLINTDVPIIDVVMMCGFSSGSYFSQCYREEFGHAPRVDRKKRFNTLVEF